MNRRGRRGRTQSSQRRGSEKRLFCAPSAFRSAPSAVSLIGLGAVLRFWNLGGLGLTHFDEGSYTMAGRWLATLGEEGWAIQAGHSPALFPVLVGLFFTLFGFQDIVAIAVSGLAGSLTVGLVYLLGRMWMGKTEALLAALFLATCEYHLIYSRMALTDATFTLLFWAALGALWKALQSGERRWALLGGVLTGLCWNTKYHGFFPLLIVAGWMLLSAFPTEAGFKRRFQNSHFGTSAAISVLAYLPWAVLVELTTGYGAVLGGQLEHAWDISPFTRTTPGILASYLNHWMSPLLLGAALLGSIGAVRERQPQQRFLLWAAFIYAAATMLYMSFPRLVLPLVPALCLLAGLGVVRLISLASSRLKRPLLVLACLTVLAGNLWDSGPLLQQRTDTYRQTANYLEDIEGLLLTQLNKNYYFYESGFKRRLPSLELRWQDLDQLDRTITSSTSIVIAVDPVLFRLEEVHAWFEKLNSRLQLVAELEIKAFEPVYYQAIAPFWNLEELPRSVAPFVPNESRINIYRVIPASGPE